MKKKKLAQLENVDNVAEIKAPEIPSLLKLEINSENL
jgi:hypothetical protein